MAEGSLRLRFSGEEVLAFLEEEKVEYEEISNGIYTPQAVMWTLERTVIWKKLVQLQWKLKKTGGNSENLCIANSQQYLCIAQLNFYSEAVPTVGQQDGVAPTELEGLRYEVNVKDISMITNGSTASFLPLTCSPQNIKWQSARTPIQVQPFSQPTGPHSERGVRYVLVFHLVHS